MMARTMKPWHLPREILDLPMFHARLSSREQAEVYMKEHHEGSGSYLVRKNSSNDPHYISITTSISDSGESCHAKVFIERFGKGYIFYIVEKVQFFTICALLGYYSRHRIYCAQTVESIKLLKPLQCHEPPQEPPPVLPARGIIPSGREDFQSPLFQSSLTNSNGEGDPTEQSKNGVKRHRSPPPIPRECEPSTLCTYPKPSKLWTQPGLNANLQQDDWLTAVAKMGYNRCKMGKAQSMKVKSNPFAVVQHENFMHRSRAEWRSMSSHSQKLISKKFTHSGKCSSSGNAIPAMTLAIKSFMQHRPPAPLPLDGIDLDFDNVYYSQADPEMKYYPEAYNNSKNMDTGDCHCGLRIEDCQLPKGWAFHLSLDPETMGHVFFQYGENTTWDLPSEIVPYLNGKQVKLICLHSLLARQEVPQCLKQRLVEVEQHKRSTTKRTQAKMSPVFAVKSFCHGVNNEQISSYNSDILLHSLDRRKSVSEESVHSSIYVTGTQSVWDDSVTQKSKAATSDGKSSLMNKFDGNYPSWINSAIVMEPHISQNTERSVNHQLGNSSIQSANTSQWGELPNNVVAPKLSGECKLPQDKKKEPKMDKMLPRSPTIRENQECFDHHSLPPVQLPQIQVHVPQLRSQQQQQWQQTKQLKRRNSV